MKCSKTGVLRSISKCVPLYYLSPTTTSPGGCGENLKSVHIEMLSNLGGLRMCQDRAFERNTSDDLCCNLVPFVICNFLLRHV